MCGRRCAPAGVPTGWQVPGWPLDMPTLGFQRWESWGGGGEEASTRDTVAGRSCSLHSAYISPRSDACQDTSQLNVLCASATYSIPVAQPWPSPSRVLVAMAWGQPAHWTPYPCARSPSRGLCVVMSPTDQPEAVTQRPAVKACTPVGRVHVQQTPC